MSEKLKRYSIEEAKHPPASPPQWRRILFTIKALERERDAARADAAALRNSIKLLLLEVGRYYP